jgi:16S rRNA (uracil1498-N3)-methyltransferase
MGVPRFYHPGSLLPHHNIKLSESAARHAGLVLRLAVGDELILFSGDGFDYEAKITEISRKLVMVAVEKKREVNNRESNLKIHLIQAVSKPDKMDWVMQKAVELGVTEMTPVITKYCAVKLDEKTMAKKLDHWQGIIISACEQSGRNIIPKLNKIIVLEEFLAGIKEIKIVAGFIFHPEAKERFSEIKSESNERREKSEKSQKSDSKEIFVMIGPEGGFHEDEVKLAEKHRFHSVRLGSRILRVETAAVAALSALQSRWGDF